MFLLNFDASKITLADLQALMDNEVVESRDIEYKRTLSVSLSPERKRKLVAGISSFANTDGGDFIIGIRAEGGIPKELAPISRTVCVRPTPEEDYLARAAAHRAGVSCGT